MQIRVGFEMAYACPQPTPMLLVLNIHHSRASDLVRPDLVVTTPAVPLLAYRDLFGNWCSRIVAPKGTLRLSTDAVVRDSGLPDVIAPDARQTPVEALPDMVASWCAPPSSPKTLSLCRLTRERLPTLCS